MENNNRNIYVDIHAIQSVPPSNINRDDTGSPKTAQYGGVTRARVSSQSWKKSMRDYFKDYNINKNMVGERSKYITQCIANEIMSIKSEISVAKAIKLSKKVLKNAGLSSENGKLEALFFISRQQVINLANAAISGKESKKYLLELLGEAPSIDMALFGRMVAKASSLNEDASCQVAHAISTHKIQAEFDFYTATDDLAPEDNAGAGMLGIIEFNSSTLYRYANVATHQFFEQLDKNKELTIEALKLFIEAFVKTMPTGKINTFANQTLPKAIIVSIRHDRPINLVNAFENPIKAEQGYVKASIERLKEEYSEVEKFVDPADFTFTIGIEGLGKEQSDLNSLVDNFGFSLSEILG